MRMAAMEDGPDFFQQKSSNLAYHHGVEKRSKIQTLRGWNQWPAIINWISGRRQREEAMQTHGVQFGAGYLVVPLKWIKNTLQRAKRKEDELRPFSINFFLSPSGTLVPFMFLLQLHQNNSFSPAMLLHLCSYWPLPAVTSFYLLVFYCPCQMLLPNGQI